MFQHFGFTEFYKKNVQKCPHKIFKNTIFTIKMHVTLQEQLHGTRHYTECNPNDEKTVDIYYQRKHN